MNAQTEISSHFTVGDYHDVRPKLDPDNPDTSEWKRVFDAFEDRINERFLRPIRELSRYDKRDELPMRPGFAILALDCLLIDTLQSFREGRVYTGEINPAASFKDFLKTAPAFSSFNNRDRDQFFSYVRNGLLHNGETRHDWRVRIDTAALLTRDSETKARTINRRLFHAGVLCEYRRFRKSLTDAPASVRTRFLRRFDAICGWPTKPLRRNYFAYGSNLLESEIQNTVRNAEPLGVAYIPGYRLAFNKHSISRNGDAANIVKDCSAIVWGFIYRVDDDAWKMLKKRELGYSELHDETAFLANGSGDVTPQDVDTFVADNACRSDCGPNKAYLDIIIEGGTSRGLPMEYVERLKSVRNGLCATKASDISC